MALNLATPPPGEEWTLAARLIFPVDAAPMRNGTITLRDDRIVAVDSKGRRSPDLDLGDVAILPGLVNAHTHLDLSDAAGKCPPAPDFTGWLRQVVAHREAQTPADVSRAITAGIAESLRHGVTLLGDIAVRGQSWLHLARSPLRSVVFYELLGLTFDGAHRALELASEWWNQHAATPNCRPGLSPHAPYTVNAMVLAALADPQGTFGWSDAPLAFHLLETEAEAELLASHSGPFVDFLRERGVWEPRALVRGPQQILPMFRGQDRICFVHCNYLAPTFRPPGTVIYCPRTHAAFGHKPHPFRALLALGTRVALGTDSLASNPDLDILSEARFVHERYPDVSGDALLRMITLSGAEALGWQQECGSLSPGKSADLAILPLVQAPEDDAYAPLFQSATAIEQVLFCGKWLARIGA